MAAVIPGDAAVTANKGGNPRSKMHTVHIKTAGHPKAEAAAEQNDGASPGSTSGSTKLGKIYGYEGEIRAAGASQGVFGIVRGPWSCRSVVRHGVCCRCLGCDG